MTDDDDRDELAAHLVDDGTLAGDEVKSRDAGLVRHLEQIVLALADADVYRSDADGWTYCGVCGSVREYAGLIQHTDDCAYLAALAYRQAQADERQEA